MDGGLASGDVRRGVVRWLVQAGVAPLAEATLGCGRRADLLGLDAAGRLVLVEIKVSRADLMGDAKWTDYLDWCDRFYWAVPPGLADLLAAPQFRPEATGLIVADGHGAALLREAAALKLAAARRKAEVVRLARRAALRLAASLDPGLDEAS
jgi:hypothetical protein